MLSKGCFGELRAGEFFLLLRLWFDPHENRAAELRGCEGGEDLEYLPVVWEHLLY